MAWLLFAMLAVLVSWLILIAVLSGVGLALQWLIGRDSISTFALLIAPWSGLAIVFLFLQLWHFVFPIAWLAATVVSVIGLSGLWLTRNELRAWFASARFTKPVIAFLAIAAIWTANRAIAPGDSFDSGMYHYQVVRWSHEYSIVPGLANLHPAYGFNNACHLFDALLKVGFWESRANHLANGSLLFTWLATSIISAARLLRGSGSRAQNVFNVVLLVPLVMFGVSKEASSPTSDLPQAVLTFAASSAFIWLLTQSWEREDTDGERALATLSVVLIGTAALCVKLTAGATVAPMGIIAMGLYVLRTRRGDEWKLSTISWGVGLSLALVLTWMARSVMLSGFALYPSRAIPFPVEWRLKEDYWSGLDPRLHEAGANVRVGMLQRAMKTPQFQKVPGFIASPLRSALSNASGTGAWIIGLLVASTVEVPLPLLITLLALIGILLVRWKKRAASERARAIEWLVCVPPLCGFVAWVAISPEPRYVASTLWMLAAACMAMSIRGMRRPTRFVTAIALLAAFPIAYRMLILHLNPLSGPVRSAIVIGPGPDRGFHPTPSVEMVQASGPFGLRVWVPKVLGATWDSPLPSSTLLMPGLTLRDPTRLDSGFTFEK